MKNGLLIFLGAFATLAFSCAGVVLFAHHQLDGLTQYRDPVDDSLNPQPLSGLADQGRVVYQDLGCVSCHTQQVRRDGFGGDIGRKWGLRQSVARDYLREKTVFLGSSRIGPDLRNIGARVFTGPDALYNILYSAGVLAPGMPAYPFLFETRPTGSLQPSHKAFKVTADGREIVPTHRAEALVAYLLSLKDTYEYPEAKPFVEAPRPEGSH